MYVGAQPAWRKSYTRGNTELAEERIWSDMSLLQLTFTPTASTDSFRCNFHAVARWETVATTTDNTDRGRCLRKDRPVSPTTSDQRVPDTDSVWGRTARAPPPSGDRDGNWATNNLARGHFRGRRHDADNREAHLVKLSRWLSRLLGGNGQKKKKKTYFSLIRIF